MATIAAVTVALVIGAAPPALAAATWESRRVAIGASTGEGLSGVSCPSASFCVAVGARGTVVTSAEPRGGAPAWRSETVAPGTYAGTAAGEPDRTSPGAFEAISCPTTGMCAAVSYAGDFYASADPAGGASTWRATDLDGDAADTHLTGVSCPTPTFCVAVASGGSAAADSDGGGRIFAVGDPLSAAVSVNQVQLDQSLDLRAVSCPSAGFCIAVADQGRIVVSADPAAAVPLWRELGAPGGPGDLGAVECADANLCLTGNAGGNVLSTTDASADRPLWQEVNSGPSVPITGISCPARSRCAAVDNNGDVVVSSDPTGPPGSWSTTSLIPFPGGGSQGLPLNALFGISCPSLDFCAAVGSRGLIFTSASPFGGEEAGEGKGHAAPPRPRMKILRSDHFARQSSTRGAGSRVTFRFRPYGRVRGFLCALDRHRFRRCRSPLRIYAKRGRHVLRARAVGVTGLKGPMARHRFEIRGPRHREVSPSGV